MTRLRYIVCLLLCSFLVNARAADSTQLVSFHRADIEALNAHNLYDLLLNCPFMYGIETQNTTEIHVGGADISAISILKDGMPLLMQQTTPINLIQISLWNIERVEIHIASFVATTNAGAITVQLFSSELKDRAFALNGQANYGLQGDLNTSVEGQISDLKHTLTFGANRSFRNSIDLNDKSRFTLTPASERYDFSLGYRYYILPGLNVEAHAFNSYFESRHSGDVIEGTTRVEDLHYHSNMRFLSGKINAQLSKKHKASIAVLHNQNRNTQYTLNKDLNSKQISFENLEPLDSLIYRFLSFDAKIEGNYNEFGYEAGIQYTTISDRVHSTINALKSENSDYTVYGLFRYSYQAAQFVGGISYLTNTNSGKYLLPKAKLVLSAKNNIKLESSYLSSIAYNTFGQTYYPNSISNKPERNNFILEPIRIQSLTNKLVIKAPNFTAVGGFIFASFKNIASLDNQNSWQNQTTNKASTTFFSLKFAQKNAELNPVFALHGISKSADTLGLNFFYPELNITGNLKLPKTKTIVTINTRFIGNYSNLYISKTAVLQDVNEGYSQINLSIRQEITPKIQFLVGVNNALNNAAIDQVQFEVLELVEVERATSKITINRRRNIFATVLFQI